MAVVPQDTLAQHQNFLLNIGYLAIINGRGPFSGIFPHSAIGKFNIRENIKDVAVGDDAYNGNEWGKVTSVTGDVTNGFSFVVKYNNTVLPQGINHATWNPSRNQTYASMLPAAADVTGLVTTNNWQKLASIGVIVVAPSNPSAATNPLITLESAAPTISAAGGNTSLDFSQGLVSVQKTVNGVNSGTPVISDALGVVSMPNGNTIGQLIRFIVTKTGYNIATFGPYTVVA